MNRRFFAKIPVFIFAVLFLAACSVTPKLYFGQPAIAFNSKAVERLLPIIQHKFPEWAIENPNQEKHQQGYQRWKEKTGTGMDYYFVELLPTMSGGIFLPFPDGSWSGGAYGEALRLEGLGLPIWKVTPDGTIEETTTEKMRLWDGGILSVRQMRERNKISYDEWVERQKTP